MFDELLELGICFDWISPVWAITQHILHGGGHTFIIPMACGWTGKEIERLLRSGGVTTWGLMHPAFTDDLLISVPKRQAERAQYILETVGIGLEGGAPAARRKSSDTGWWFFS